MSLLQLLNQPMCSIEARNRGIIELCVVGCMVLEICCMVCCVRNCYVNLRQNEDDYGMADVCNGVQTRVESDYSLGVRFLCSFMLCRTPSIHIMLPRRCALVRVFCLIFSLS